MGEDLLRRYRPVGPFPGLRSRVVIGARPAWPWAVAAAALLVATLVLHARTSSLAANIVEPSSAVWPPEVRIDYIAGMLGGGPDANRAAALIVMEEEIRAALPPVAPAAAAAEGPR